jgi:hypothetical protein
MRIGAWGVPPGPAVEGSRDQTMFLETADGMNGPWTAMATQTFGVADDFSGAVFSPSGLVRVRVEIIASEISSMACRLAARAR